MICKPEMFDDNGNTHLPTTAKQRNAGTAGHRLAPGFECPATGTKRPPTMLKPLVGKRNGCYGRMAKLFPHNRPGSIDDRCTANEGSAPAIPLDEMLGVMPGRKKTMHKLPDERILCCITAATERSLAVCRRVATMGRRTRHDQPTPRRILTHEQRCWLWTQCYAVRGTTMCGQAQDFD